MTNYDFDQVRDDIEALYRSAHERKHEGPAIGAADVIEDADGLPGDLAGEIDRILAMYDGEALSDEFWAFYNEEIDGNLTYQDGDTDETPDGEPYDDKTDTETGDGTPYDIPDEIDLNHNFPDGVPGGAGGLGEVPWEDIVDAVRDDNDDGDEDGGDGQDEDDYDPTTLDIGYEFDPQGLENIGEDEEFPTNADLSYSVMADGDDQDDIDELYVRVGELNADFGFAGEFDEDTVYEAVVDRDGLNVGQGFVGGELNTIFQGFEAYDDLERGEQYGIEVQARRAGEDEGFARAYESTGFIGEPAQADEDVDEDAPEVTVDAFWEDGDMEYATGGSRWMNAVDGLLANDGWIGRARGLWNGLREHETDVDRWYSTQFTGEDIDELDDYDFVLEAAVGSANYRNGDAFQPDPMRRVESHRVPAALYNPDNDPGERTVAANNLGIDYNGETYLDNAADDIADNGRTYHEPVPVESVLEQLEPYTHDGDREQFGLRLKVVDNDGDVVQNAHGEALRSGWEQYSMSVFDGREAITDAEFEKWSVPETGKWGFEDSWNDLFGNDNSA
jgi:hypothetical protein